MTRSKQRFYSDAQLGWVQSTRAWKGRTESIGSMANRAVENIRVNDSATVVRDAIDAIVDDVFREHCRLESVSGGRVVLVVDDSDLLYHIRTKWHIAIKEHLERTLRKMTVRAIIFKRGDMGLAFTVE